MPERLEAERFPSVEQTAITRTALEKGVVRVEAQLVEGGAAVDEAHEVVVEEPLEIRVAGEPIALTMRTPGEDRYLALGFLFAEGVLGALDDVGSVYHCGRTCEERYGNVLEVTPGPGARLDVDALSRTKRVGLTQSACGVCGRDAIDDLLTRIAPLPRGARIDARVLGEAPTLLRSRQANFMRTGGLHAACAIGPDGTLLAHAEDIGRHNAVDKVVGKLLYAGALPRLSTPSEACVLAVSGRASFEIVQKAAAAGFVCVASVSAASSLAIETARALDVTLASFVRDGRFTLYTASDRVLIA